jgi:SAM-dependent methyltransferase
MPSIAENKREWDGAYRWNERGDEWSREWGGVSLQWYATLLPRIHSHVPTGTILEIACGYGRWSQYLKDLADRLVVVDLSEECIDACKKRFASAPNIDYHVNDGTSLAMVPTNSVDFIFSFDSLVHVDQSVLTAYLKQFQRILTNDGVAFLHHSNLGEYSAKYRRIRTVPKLEGLLITLGALDSFLHWRDPGVSAGVVERIANDNGLRCVSQEIVHWRTQKTLIDCMSTIVKQGSTFPIGNRVCRNPRFMAEAANSVELARLYERATGR